MPGTDRSTGELSPRLGLQPPAASRQGEEGKLQTRLGRQSTDATATGEKDFEFRLDSNEIIATKERVATAEDRIFERNPT